VKSFSLFLAWRYLRQTAYEQSTSTMVRICFLSILVGTFSLALVTAVMRGFELAAHEKMQGIHAQITIESPEPLDIDAIETILHNEFPQIIASAPNSSAYAIVQPQLEDASPSVIMLRGIDPTREQAVSTIDTKVVKPTDKALAKMISGKKILLGQNLAHTLGVTVGNPVTLNYTDTLSPQGRKLSMKQYEATVGGIFKSGIDEFDAGVIFCSNALVEKLSPSAGITQLNVKIASDANEKQVISRLRERLELEVYSWKERYPTLLAALLLERYAMFFVIALITLVASMNIVSLLFMQITNKRPDIAILTTLGARMADIRRVFLWIGMSLACIACTLGLLLATGAAYLLEQYPFITLPDIYYTTHLPARMEWQTLALTFAAVMLVSFLAAWIPTRRLRTINISNVLRFEG